MMEAGDNVGPFVARLRDERGGTGAGEGQSLKNTKASQFYSSSSSFSSFLRSFQMGKGRKVFGEGQAEILQQSSSSSRLFLRSFPVRAKPVVATILMSVGLGYAVADFALKKGGRREEEDSLGCFNKERFSLQDKERNEETSTETRKPLNISSHLSSSSSTFVDSF
ncbi:zinc finger cdgsh type protein [Cystoisospora suis]|uniref:Zinc finger cdgsh type protein n=1 Tax=Cystoisospora suis TaxID=483139 RepID=A0A2C6J7D7_9APIC|nr:zinc finger cdgsh type protein [Cystoisospora suis]